MDDDERRQEFNRIINKFMPDDDYPVDVGETLANLLDWQQSPEYVETDTWLSGLVRAEAANNPDADEFGVTQRVLDRLSYDELKRAAAFLAAGHIIRTLIARGIEQADE